MVRRERLGGQLLLPTGEGGGIDPSCSPHDKDEEVDVHDPKSGEVYWTGPRHEAEKMLKETEEQEGPNHGLQLRKATKSSVEREHEEAEKFRLDEERRTKSLEDAKHQESLAQPDGYLPGHKKYVDPPERLWHATYAADKIKAEGFKSSDELGSGVLGGSAGNLVSFTTKENAKLYRDALNVARLAARGELTDEQTIKHGVEFGVSESKMRQLMDETSRKYKGDSDYDKSRRSFNLWQQVAFEGKKFPVFMGRGWSQTVRDSQSASLVSIKSSDVTDIRYAPGETEWRVGGNLKKLAVNSLHVTENENPNHDELGRFSSGDGVSLPPVGTKVKVGGQHYRAESFDDDDTFPPAIAHYEVKDGHIFYTGRNGSEGVVTGTKEESAKWMKQVRDEVQQRPPEDSTYREWHPSDGGKENVEAAKDMVKKAAEKFGIEPPAVRIEVAKRPLEGGEHSRGQVFLANPHLKTANDSLNFKTDASNELAIAAHETMHEVYSTDPQLGKKYQDKLANSGETVSIYHSLAGHLEGLMDLGATYVHSPEQLKRHSPKLYKIADDWSREMRGLSVNHSLPSTSPPSQEDKADPWYDGVLNWSEEQERDEHGRWTSRGELSTKLESWLSSSLGGGTSPPSQEKVSQLRNAFKAAHDGLPKGCREQAMANVKEVKFHGSIDSLTDQARQEGMWVRTGQKVGGLAITEPGESKVTLHLDGGDETGEGYGDLAKHLMAHELGHAADPGGRHSSSPEWRDAFNAEVKVPGDPLSRYATKSPREGFAEYARLMVADRSKAERDFPRCWAAWEKRGLLD